MGQAHVESATGWFSSSAHSVSFGQQAARPFVGFVQVDVVQRDADAQHRQ
jgi:hypothetical protein